MMKRLILMSFLLISASGIGYCQNNSEEKAVAAVIEKIFKGMELGDSAMVSSGLMKETSMVSVFKDKDGNPIIRRDPGSKDHWVQSIGTPRKEVYYEEIWDLKVQIDGNFAQAWCNYAFYLDNKFSHCGVDAFHLFKDKDGWKVFHLADTRKRADCDIPKKIQDKHK